MAIIFSNIVKDFPFFYSDVMEYGFGFGCKFCEDILDFIMVFSKSVFQKMCSSIEITNIFGGSDVGNYWEKTSFAPFWSRDFSALVGCLLERMKTHLQVGPA